MRSHRLKAMVDARRGPTRSLGSDKASRAEWLPLVPLVLLTSGVVALEPEVRRESNGVLSVDEAVVRSSDRRSSGVASGTSRSESEAEAEAVSGAGCPEGMSGDVMSNRGYERRTGASRQGRINKMKE